MSQRKFRHIAKLPVKRYKVISVRRRASSTVLPSARGLVMKREPLFQKGKSVKFQGNYHQVRSKLWYVKNELCLSKSYLRGVGKGIAFINKTSSVMLQRKTRHNQKRYVNLRCKVIFVKPQSDTAMRSQMSDYTTLVEDTTTTLQSGIETLTKATEEDRNKNYEEAICLYRKGLEAFAYAMKHEVRGERAKCAVQTKYSEYLERLKSLETFVTLRQKVPTSIEDGVEAARQAVQEDYDKNYVEALKLYEMTVMHFKNAIENEVVGERAKEAIRNKSALYEKRAELIRKYLFKKEEKDTTDHSCCTIS